MVDKKLDEIKKDISLIKSSIVKIDKTLAINTKSLEEHMRRTELLEKELKPVTRHVLYMQGAGKLIFMLSLLASIVAAFLMIK